MSMLDLTTDELLTTTRSVRKRLDLTRPVEAEIIRECLKLALYTPSGGGSQGWHFLVVTDPAQRAALAALYRKAAAKMAGYVEQDKKRAIAAGPEKEAAFARMMDSSRYLTDHLHEVPLLVLPCIEGRDDALPAMQRAVFWGSIFPSVWSFMLAARSRGLGTVLTSMHLLYEREAAAVLGIPYEHVTQAALIPVAYTLGTAFKPAARKPLETVLHWDRW